MRRLFLLMFTLLVLVAGCGGDDDDNGNGSADTAVETTPAETTAEGEGGCEEVAQPKRKDDGGEEQPSEELTGDYSVTFETNCGSFTVEIDEEAGGLSAASFVALADNGFYEDTFFHRIVPGFVIQGGDPTGSGLGGPGYTTEDPPPDGFQYKKGSVAMAKAGPEPPGTAGSQFFVVTDAQGAAALTPDYAFVGKVVDGMDVVETIGALGDPASPTGEPTQIVKIEKATVEGG